MLITLTFCTIPFMIIFMDDSLQTLLAILAAYFFTIVFGTMLQGVTLASCALFGPKYTALFFCMESCFNIVLMLFKNANHFVNGNPINDVIIAWSLFLFISIGLITSFLKMAESPKFVKHENKERENVMKNLQKHLTFQKTAVKIKW